MNNNTFKNERKLVIALKEYVDRNANDIKLMLGGKSLRYITQEEYNNLSDEEKNAEDIVWNIIDVEDNCATKEELHIVENMLGGRSIRYVTQAEFDELSDDEKNDNGMVYFVIDDEDENNEEVVQVDPVDNILNLTVDKYQKTTITDGTEIIFPEVNKFTEIHLYFDADDDMNLIFPDCRWRIEPNIEAGKSYEVIATYNTIRWLVNIIVYS